MFSGLNEVVFRIKWGGSQVSTTVLARGSCINGIRQLSPIYFITQLNYCCVLFLWAVITIRIGTLSFVSLFRSMIFFLIEARILKLLTDTLLLCLMELCKHFTFSAHFFICKMERITIPGLFEELYNVIQYLQTGFKIMYVYKI